MKNCSIKQIAKMLQEAESVLLFPHLQMDGDALGSSAALCRALRKAGKQAYILIEDEIPANLAFLDEGCCTEELEVIKEPDVCLSVDCSDLSRIEKRKSVYFSGKKTISIDHHITNEPFAEYNMTDVSAAAAGEIVYHILGKMKAEIDPVMAEALYAAIATDTGNFQYSNTTKKTHLITAALFDHGMDHDKVAVAVYQSVRPQKIRLMGLALSSMEFFCNGRGIISCITQEILKSAGAEMNETEGIVEQLRNINGVEIAIVLKEDENRVKVGMRSKTTANVAEIALKFGGGGHRKAAGCTIENTIENVKKQIIEAAEAQLLSVKG